MTTENLACLRCCCSQIFCVPRRWWEWIWNDAFRLYDMGEPVHPQSSQFAAASPYLNVVEVRSLRFDQVPPQLN